MRRLGSDDVFGRLEYPPQFPKINKEQDSQHGHDAERYKVAAWRFELWHVLKIHAINTCYQAERQDNGRDDGEGFHDVICTVGNNCKMDVEEPANEVSITFG